MEKIKELTKGKAKSLFTTSNNDQLIMHFSDDTSAFDGKKKEALLGKGTINNQFNAFIMEHLKENNVETHLIDVLNTSDSLVYKLNMCCRMDGISDDKLTSFYNEFAVANRFDNEDTIYVKRMLQHILPENLRNSISSQLFQDYVGIRPEDFSQKLYMNIDEVSNLVKCGMYVGSHTYNHMWLGSLSREMQNEEIEKSHNVEQELADLKSEMNEIKSLLKELVNGN